MAQPPFQETHQQLFCSQDYARLCRAKRPVQTPKKESVISKESVLTNPITLGMSDSDSTNWIVTAEGGESGPVTYRFRTKVEASISAAGLRAAGYQSVRVERAAATVGRTTYSDEGS
jgi:hypothetical protein